MTRENTKGKELNKPREKYIWTEDYENIIGKKL